MAFYLPFSETRSATPTLFDFGANIPFTCVPAYDLPVYASQCPLPDPTQNSVHGGWLGFAAVAISDDKTSCACKAQLRHNFLNARVYDTYEDIVDACCWAWTSLLKIEGQLKSITTRSWAKTVNA